MNRRINLDAPVSPSRRRAVSLAVAALIFGLLAGTSDRLPLAWDEGDSLWRAEFIYEWFIPPYGGRLTADVIQQRLAAEEIESHWKYTTVREGHPALLGVVVSAGWAVAEHYFAPLTAARSGPMLLLAIALSAAFYRLWKEYTFSVALTAVGAALTMPRFFAHAHFALFDSLVTSGWLLAWATFRPALDRWRYCPLWGLMLGLALSAKFTGWLAPCPFVLWAILYRDRRALKALAIGLPVALATFVALNPPLWHDPLAGLAKFFALNLHRGDRPGHNISTLFAGRMYNLDYPLPWYNGLVWTAITILPFALLLGVWGAVKSARRWRSDSAGVLLVSNWATLIVVRALPWAPPHDAERLILPSFAFFALLIGVGAGRCLYRESLLLPEKICAQRWAIVLLAMIAANGTIALARFAPQWLSYYSPLVGGLPGAVALGFEPTYYWDSLDAEAIAWLNEHTPRDRAVRFAPISESNVGWLFWWKKLRFLRYGQEPKLWYVMQRRPSAYRDEDYWLIDHAQPAFEKRLQGVPLLDIYAYSDYLRARSASAEINAPDQK